MPIRRDLKTKHICVLIFLRYKRGSDITKGEITKV